MNWGILKRNTHVDELDQFRKNLNSLFRDFFELAPVSLVEQGLSPSVDIEEKDSEYIVKADIPGFDPADIELSVQDNVLTISGERSSEEKEEKKNYLYSERTCGSFKRTLQLPKGINGNGISAKYKNGVLSVAVPKSEEVVKKIAIESK